jgi:hypothetical protein
MFYFVRSTTVSGKSSRAGVATRVGERGKYMYNTSKLPFSMRCACLRVSVRSIVYVFAPLLPPL